MSSVTVNLPHKFSPRDYQLPFLQAVDGGIKRAILVWHRRSGKDKTCFNFMVKKAFERVGTYFYFLPSYKQAKKVIWDNIDNDGFRMLDHIPKQLIKSSNSVELKIELVNGSIIQLIAADEFKESGVGTNPVGVVFSEYSINKPEAWRYVSPILAANGGWAIFNFTPRGINHAHDLLQRAKDNVKWFTQILTVDETNVFTKEALDEERRDNPQDFIEQEYYCKFIEGAGSFFRRLTENLWDGNLEQDRNRQYQLGVDLAKYQDWTVITTIDLHNFRVGKQDRFNQIDYNLQKARIEAACLRWNTAQVVLDSTGVGEPVYDDLSTRIPVVPFKFTEKTRNDLLKNLAIMLEQDKIKIPNDEILLDELRSMQYSMSDQGKVKVAVPDGRHDDMVMSLALAVWGLTNPIPERNVLQNFNFYAQQTFD